MNKTTLRAERVSPIIGATVSGIDLAVPLDEATVASLRQALADHLVLFFRDQDITKAQHAAFGRCFGDLHIHPAAPKDAAHPEILTVHADDKVTFVAGSAWHSDVSCDVEPPLGSILRVVQIPSSGGDTLFANMYAAFAGLSPPMQRLVSGLTAVHEGEQYYRDRYGTKQVVVRDRSELSGVGRDPRHDDAARIEQGSQAIEDGAQDGSSSSTRASTITGSGPIRMIGLRSMLRMSGRSRPRRPSVSRICPS